jgi:hypothetical protein
LREIIYILLIKNPVTISNTCGNWKTDQDKIIILNLQIKS